jgi:hypothetical protein
VVDTLITIAEHLWASSYGPRTENVLEYALKTLSDANELFIQSDPYQGPDRQYTLLDVVPLLRAASFRHAVLEQVRDSLLSDWWQYYYEPMDLRFQMEVISSVLNKLSKFASSRTTRRILGQPRSTINFTEVIRSGKILLVSPSKPCASCWSTLRKSSAARNCGNGCGRTTHSWTTSWRSKEWSTACVRRWATLLKIRNSSRRFHERAIVSSPPWVETVLRPFLR